MKTEFTEFQKEAMMIINLLRLHQEELESSLQDIFPNSQTRITARSIPIYNKPSKEDSMVYQTEDGKEYLITSSGANDLAPEWYNDKLFISFIDMSDKGDKDGR
jgi:hypothetical protein